MSFEPFEAKIRESGVTVRFFDRYLKQTKDGQQFPLYVGESSEGTFLEVPVWELRDKFQSRRSNP